MILLTRPGIPEALLEVPNDWKRCSRSLSRHRSAVLLNVRLTLIYARVYTQDPAEGFILNYTLLIGDASFSNFQKVCVCGYTCCERCHVPLSRNPSPID